MSATGSRTEPVSDALTAGDSACQAVAPFGRKAKVTGIAGLFVERSQVVRMSGSFAFGRYPSNGTGSEPQPSYVGPAGR